LGWVLDDGNNAFEFFRGEFTGAVTLLDSIVPSKILLILPLVEIDIGLLADQVGVSATYTPTQLLRRGHGAELKAGNVLDLGEGVHDLLLAINIGVEETQNELEVRLLSGDERHAGRLTWLMFVVVKLHVVL
jgi:hypothetical protein